MAKMMSKRICECCGEEYTPKNYNSKHCLKCRTDYEGDCTKCGRHFRANPLVRKNKYLDLCKFCRSELICIETHGMKPQELAIKKFQERTGLKSPWQLEKTKESIKSTLVERYGVDNAQKNKEIHNKTLETRIAKYGDTKMFGTRSFQEEYEKNCIAKYGVKNGGGTKESIEKIKKSIFNNNGHHTSWGCSERYYYEDLSFDSSWELAYYLHSKDKGIDIVRNETLSFEYEYDGNKFNYYPDFIIGKELIEIKGSHFFKNGEMIDPYNREPIEKVKSKYRCMLEHNIQIITNVDECISYVNEKYGKSFLKDSKIIKEMFGIKLNQLVDYCLSKPFPGTNKWSSSHPIWDCYVGNKISPKVAWENRGCLKKAVGNMFSILKYSIDNGKYESFVAKHKKAFDECIVEDGIIVGGDSILSLVLDRFTIAKIAPKVTALRSNDLLKIVEQSNVDISSGVYCPMAGFGGIVEGCRKWFNDRGLEPNIEAYDINKDFCDWYGWIQRDVLAQVVETNKVVVVCPPFGEEYEHWNGTPREMSNIQFKEWCKLIKEHIKAKDYIFIGPELDKNSKNNKCGLFKRKVGIQLYKDI